MGYSCDEFYSHRGLLLKDHLNSVGLLCRRYVKDAGISDPTVLKVAEIIGKGHDLAKYTEFFQRHLFGEREGAKSTHSRLSAFITSWIVYKTLEDDGHPYKTDSNILDTIFFPLIASVCVYSHHGHLVNLSKIIEEVEYKSRNDPIILKQVNSIKNNMEKISGELRKLHIEQAQEFILDFDAKMDALYKVFSEKAYFKLKIADDVEKNKVFFLTKLLFSALIDADKKDAARISVNTLSNNNFSIKSDIVHQYRKLKYNKDQFLPVNNLRNELFNTAVNKLEKNFDKIKSSNIITITAPTGMGKTILGLYTALKLREVLTEDGVRPKIIYCLPYINIIEQSYSTIKDVLSNTIGEENVSINLLLKHHHLYFPEEKQYKRDSDTEIPVDKMLLLIDSWNSEVIVTTFIQLFNSLIGSKNTSLKKFHNIANSIIILDEIQSAPLEYWRLIRDVLSMLTIHLNVKIIFMSATMPGMFRNYELNDRITELIPNYKDYFRKLDRITIETHLDKEITVDEFVDFFFRKWDKHKSVLIVVNTIKTSKKIYNAIKKSLSNKVVCLSSDKENEHINKDKIVLGYLSTSIVPIERERRIELIKKLLEKKHTVILISTQTVEAGVDLDFEIAFRDLGPLDSIVQVAGRCNRNWRNINGMLYAVKLVDEKGNVDAHKIYGKILPDITERLLDNKFLKEHKLIEVVEEYYNNVIDRMDTLYEDKSIEYLGYIKELDFDKLLEFKMIEEEPKIPIFIGLNDKANHALEKFREAINRLESLRKKNVDINEVFKAKAEVRKYRIGIENYIVSVWLNKDNRGKISSLKEIYPGLKYVDYNVLDAYYDRETGFKTEVEEDIFW